MRTIPVANSVLAEFWKTRKDINHLQLQKLIYLLNIECENLLGESFVVVGDSAIVLASLWGKLKHYGGRSIDEYIEEDGKTYFVSKENGIFYEKLSGVLSRYGSLSPAELSIIVKDMHFKKKARYEVKK